MLTLHTQYIVNENGEQTAVVLDIREYRELLEWLEELEDVRAFDAAMQGMSETLPLELALAELDKAA